jgi:protein ImuA
MTKPVAIEELRSRIRRLEGGFGEPEARRHIPTGLGSLDRLLAGGGLPAGAIVAILGAGGGPGEVAWTLAVVFAAAIVRSGPGESVLVDRAGELYPPAVAALSASLERTIFVRPARARDGPWALEEALRSPAVAVAAGEARSPKPADVRRLELAAEAGGGIGLVLAREREAGALGHAPVVLRVEPAPGAGGLAFRVAVVRSRGGSGETGREVEVHVSADSVRDVPGAVHRPARASGARAAG